MVYSCFGSYAKIPYYLESTHLHIFSIEELCYYFQHNLELLDESIMNLKMCEFIETQLQLGDLSRKLAGLIRSKADLCAFVSTILEDTYYCNHDELKKIEQLLRESDTMGREERLKIRGDFFYQSGKIDMAMKVYQKALICPEESLKEDTKGDIYHNLGVCYARLFQFELAAKSFLNAYGFNNEEDTYEQYLAALRLGNSKDKYLDIVLKEHIPQEKVTSLEEKIGNTVPEIKASKEYLEYERTIQVKKDGKVSEYYENLGHILSEFKKEYCKNTCNE